jgi:hypothetical protein
MIGNDGEWDLPPLPERQKHLERGGRDAMRKSTRIAGAQNPEGCWNRL